MGVGVCCEVEKGSVPILEVAGQKLVGQQKQARQTSHQLRLLTTADGLHQTHLNQISSLASMLYNIILSILWALHRLYNSQPDLSEDLDRLSAIRLLYPAISPPFHPPSTPPHAALLETRALQRRLVDRR